MCGRFTQTLTAGDWRRLLKTHVPDGVRPSYNISPTQQVLTFDGQARMQTWSFLPAWAQKTSGDGSRAMRPVINARIETAAEKPYFRGAWKNGRVVIPATGFIEWQKRSSGKHPHHITLSGGEPFGFAGLRDGDGVAILTTEPNELMATIHDRMPVLLRPNAFGGWIDGADWSQTASDELTATEIGTEVNSPANNNPELLQPVAGPAD